MKISISGVRGIFGNDLNLNDIIYFCRNFSSLIGSKRCALSRDTRPSSKILSDVAAASLMERGISVYNLGIAATPVLFKESRKYGSGIIITSSHNPLQWNGMKFVIEGRGINESELKQLTKEKQFSKEKVGIESEISSKYAEQATKMVGILKKQTKVAVDVGGGAAFEVGPKILENIGCKVTKINGLPGKSSRGPDPTTDRLLDLKKLSKKVDVAFAFDLDGDRVVVVKDGKKQAPDVTLGLGVAATLDMGYKRFVLSIDTSVAVEKMIKESSGNVKRSKVGEANVVDLILRTKSQAGGEGSSAGFILPEFNMCRDGLLTSGLIASMAGTSKLKDVIKFLESYFQRRVKINAESRFHGLIMNKLYKKFEKKFSEVITLDGIKSIIDEDSWVLVRPSNTEHSIRISAESNSLSKSRSLEKDVTNMVKQCYEEARRIRNY